MWLSHNSRYTSKKDQKTIVQREEINNSSVMMFDTYKDVLASQVLKKASVIMQYDRTTVERFDV